MRGAESHVRLVRCAWTCNAYNARWTVMSRKKKHCVHTQKLFLIFLLYFHLCDASLLRSILFLFLAHSVFAFSQFHSDREMHTFYSASTNKHTDVRATNGYKNNSNETFIISIGEREEKQAKLETRQHRRV